MFLLQSSFCLMFLCLDAQILPVSTENCRSDLLTMHSRTSTVSSQPLPALSATFLLSLTQLSFLALYTSHWTFSQHTHPSHVLGILNSLFFSPKMLSFLFSSIQQILTHISRSRVHFLSRRSHIFLFIHSLNKWEMLGNGELNHMWSYVWFM